MPVADTADPARRSRCWARPCWAPSLGRSVGVRPRHPNGNRIASPLGVAEATPPSDLASCIATGPRRGLPPPLRDRPV